MMENKVRASMLATRASHIALLVLTTSTCSFFVVEHNYDSAGKGGNRFATILLYMTDLGPGDGGETVFVNGKPLGDNPTPYKQALQELRASEQGKLFKRDSWEEKMVASCRSKLAVVPKSGRAVLFYSQLPNGRPDPVSLHGGCPVVTSEPKWAANLWVWNTPVSNPFGLFRGVC